MKFSFSKYVAYLIEHNIFENTLFNFCFFSFSRFDNISSFTIMAWTNEDVVQFVESFCDTCNYSQRISSSEMSGKAFLFMTMEGWQDLGVPSMHRHALLGWCKHIFDGQENLNSNGSRHVEPRQATNIHTSCIKDGSSTSPKSKPIPPDALPVTHDWIF